MAPGSGGYVESESGRGMIPGRRATKESHAAVAAARVTFWGALAMAATAGIGKLFGVGML